MRKFDLLLSCSRKMIKTGAARNNLKVGWYSIVNPVSAPLLNPPWRFSRSKYTLQNHSSQRNVWICYLPMHIIWFSWTWRKCWIIDIPRWFSELPPRVLTLPRWYHLDSPWCLLQSHRDHSICADFFPEISSKISGIW